MNSNWDSLGGMLRMLYLYISHSDDVIIGA